MNKDNIIKKNPLSSNSKEDNEKNKDDNKRNKEANDDNERCVSCCLCAYVYYVVTNMCSILVS